jgi:hypothetical protein
MSKREMLSKYQEYSFMTFLGGLFEIKFYNVGGTKREGV